VITTFLHPEALLSIDGDIKKLKEIIDDASRQLHLSNAPPFQQDVINVNPVANFRAPHVKGVKQRQKQEVKLIRRKGITLKNAITLGPPRTQGNTETPAATKGAMPSASGLNDGVRSSDTAEVEEDTEKGDSVKSLSEIKGNEKGQTPAEPSSVEAILGGKPTLQGAAARSEADNLVRQKRFKMLTKLTGRTLAQRR
jgi:hypothetical protein